MRDITYGSGTHHDMTEATVHITYTIGASHDITEALSNYQLSVA